MSLRKLIKITLLALVLQVLLPIVPLFAKG